MEVEKHLATFIKEVVRQSKSNLTRQDRNVSKKLYNSIKGDFKVHKNSIGIYFTMEEHGEYLDKGVRGAGGTRNTTSKFNKRDNKGKIWKQKAPKSPFRFRDKKPSVKHFKEWARSKGLNPYAVRESVYRQGIAPSLFFTKAFEGRFKKLPNELIDKFGLDIDEQFNDILK